MQLKLIKVTVMLEGSFWIGLFERSDIDGYTAAKKIFGEEPTDAELYQFILNNYHELNFTTPQEFTLRITRRNYKRMQRDVKREMQKMKENKPNISYAQETLRLELEKAKKIKKIRSKAEKEAKINKKFFMKQEKKKKRKKNIKGINLKLCRTIKMLN